MSQNAPNRGHEIPHLDGIGDIAGEYDVFFLDIFGLLHNGIDPYEGVVDCLQRLRRAGKQIALISNTPKRSDYAARDLTPKGITPDLYDFLVTAGETTWHALHERGDSFHAALGTRCWFMGSAPFAHLCDGLGLDILNEPEGGDFILNAIPGTEGSDTRTLEELLQIAATCDMPMVCANPDIVVNVGDEQFDCAGKYASLYEGMGGRVAYHGKPYFSIYERAWQACGKPERDKICALGDALHTDIQGAETFGIDGFLNLCGIHWEELQLDHAPGQADMTRLASLIDGQAHRPRATFEGFRW